MSSNKSPNSSFEESRLHMSLSPEGEEYKVYGNFCTKSSDVAYNPNKEDIKPPSFYRDSTPQETRKQVNHPEIITSSTNEKYYFDPESKSFVLKDEHKTAHQSSKFKLSHILILLLLVETSYIIFSHISTPSTVSIPTPSPVSITPTPRPQKSNADYWQEKLDALEVETTDKDSYYSPTFFINGELLVEPFSPCVCPLTVSVQGNDSYYVYMECLSNWNDDISFMIRANSTVDINVPEGSYEFYYATGEYWYGQVNKFGPDTQYYKADTILDFTSDNEYFYGHELELWTQAGGNMERTAIDESTFPG